SSRSGRVRGTTTFRRRRRGEWRRRWSPLILARACKLRRQGVGTVVFQQLQHNLQRKTKLSWASLHRLHRLYLLLKPRH
ncbi:hypothetical protein LTR60_004808, partial [Cryomyces antarcticus]